ncbi:MAG TPA: glycosyltransferase family 39 protein [Pyrinomonadaceae bacterium]|nr:glycosyltransferase family 39 protein [Pyrinomonadaceae bacterium]
MSIFLAWFSRAIFGDSLYAIHLFPAIAGALKIIITGLIVREFGGRHVAMLLACLGVLVAPVYLAVDLLLSMNVYESIFWMGCVLSYIWVVKREDPRYWLMFGAFAGLGLMNKHSIVFFGVALVAGLIATRDRKFIADRYFWLGGLVAFLLFLPNIIWQFENNWATLELLRNVKETGKNVVLGPLEFFWQQIFILLPFTAPIWLAGIWYLIVDRDGKRFRALGVAYLFTLLLMILLGAKNYYLVPIYPMLFAAGGVLLEKVSSGLRFREALVISYSFVLGLFGIVFLPMAVPILAVENLIAYQEKLGIEPPKTEVGHNGPLPQHFGDRFGWEGMVEKVAAVYHSLPPHERKKAAIYAGNYGEAGAIDRFGPAYGLPKAISGHQSYFMWGPREYDGSVILLLGSKREEAERNCSSVEVSDLVEHPYAMAEERFSILVCRGLKTPLPELWPKLKHWN